MAKKETLAEIRCCCSICQAKGKVGEVVADSGDREWPRFYCAPTSGSLTKIEEYTVICLSCAVKHNAELREEHPDWFSSQKFLPTLLEEMEKQAESEKISLQKPRLGNHQAVYQRNFADMTAAQRVEQAGSAKGELLLALCLDPDPGVIKRVLENHASGLEHFRLIAKAHKSSQGLDFICRNARLLQDLHIQSNLLKNQAMSEPQLRKILRSKTLTQIWNITTNKDFADIHRQNSRRILKEKSFASAPEEKAALICESEGSVLNLLHDVPFDAKTTELLCKREYYSHLLIRNLAICIRTPAKLLKHLLKQIIIKRNKALQDLIKRHQNFPKAHQAKRKN